eukprot:3066188-Rhodomonas_salina.1
MILGSQDQDILAFWQFGSKGVGFSVVGPRKRDRVSGLGSRVSCLGSGVCGIGFGVSRVWEPETNRSSSLMWSAKVTSSTTSPMMDLKYFSRLNLDRSRTATDRTNRSARYPGAFHIRRQMPSRSGLVDQRNMSCRQIDYISSVPRGSDQLVLLCEVVCLIGSATSL